MIDLIALIWSKEASQLSITGNVFTQSCVLCDTIIHHQPSSADLTVTRRNRTHHPLNTLFTKSVV